MHTYFLLPGRAVMPITVTATPRSLRITEGSSALFLCSVRWSIITSTRSWSRDGYGILPASALVHDGTLAFKNAGKYDSGVYTCTASNQVTTATATVVLSVGGKFIYFICLPLSSSLSLSLPSSSSLPSLLSPTSS